MMVISEEGVIVHDEVPVQYPPDHPENVESDDGDAVRVILDDTVSEQSLPHDMPVPVTVPVPEPILVTETVWVVGVGSESSMTL